MVQILGEGALDIKIENLKQEPDVIRLGLQTRACDTGALHSDREFGSLRPRVLIISAELANLVVGVLVVNTDTEGILVLEADHGELRVRDGLEFSRKVAVIPFSSSPATIATLCKRKMGEN